MTDTNYTPDETRLLDEFAGRFVGGLASRDGSATNDFLAQWSYNVAAALIAERRRRLPKPVPSAGDLLREAIEIGRRGDLGAAVTPMGTSIPAQPEPAADPKDGELTEENVAEWERDAAWIGPNKEFNITKKVADYTVAMLREGLRYRQELGEQLAINSNCNEYIDELRKRSEQAEKERDEARAERDQWKAKWEHTIDVPLAGLLKQLQEMECRAERAEKAEAAFRGYLEYAKNLLPGWEYHVAGNLLAAHHAPKAEGGAS